MEWMWHRKWRETKQNPSMFPGPAVPGCCLVSFCFLCDIHSIHSVQFAAHVTSNRIAWTGTRCTWPPTRPPTSTRSPRIPRRSRWCTTMSCCPRASPASSAWCSGPTSRVCITGFLSQRRARLRAFPHRFTQKNPEKHAT